MVELIERQQDMCPICKTDRYLSPDMKFLVNPECYHKMCESCVDRIFAMGPAPCPYPGCGKTLRKNKFKTQIFDDIIVEREIDIRKRISTIFNKTIDDFNNDLIKYNEYLEEVETMVFNLVNKVDYEETEERLKNYEESNKLNIEENNANREREYQDFKQREEFEQNLKMKKLMLEKQIEQEEKQMNEMAKRELLNKLSSSDMDAKQAITQVRKSQLKRSSARRKQLDDIMDALNAKNTPQPSLQSEDGGQFTPFNGDRIVNMEKYFKLQKNYYDPFIDELKMKKEYIASGFDVEQVYERVISEAFIGLNCFISKEKKTNTSLMTS